MDHPIAVLIFVAVIGLALALGVVSDLRATWAQLRAGATRERRGGYQALAAGVDRAQGWRQERPLHRNYGIPAKRYTPVTYSPRGTGSDDIPVLSGTHPGLVTDSSCILGRDFKRLD
ncbi:MAG: hypothetical protein WCP82_11985 [Alphaproteobacteria bacterium]